MSAATDRDEAAGAELVYLTGTVRPRDEAARVVAGYCTLETGEGEPRRGAASGAFELELDDGTLVGVEPMGGSFEKRLVPEHTARGAWADLEQTALARLVEKHAPGPLVRVKLRGAVLERGARVCVVGAVMDYGFGEQAGGMRSAPAARPSQVRAEVIAVGDGAEALARRTYAKLHPPARTAHADRATAAPHDPTPPARGHLPWLALAALAVLIDLVLLQGSMLAPCAVMIALAAVASAVWIRPAVARAPSFVLMGATGLGRLNQQVAYLGGGWLVLGMLGLIGAAIASHDEPRFVPVAFVCCVATALVLWLLLASWLIVRRDARLTASLLRGIDADRAAVGGGGGGARPWTTIRGTVRDPTPVHDVDGGEAAMVRSESDGSSKSATKGSFQVETDDGAVVDVDPQGALWATTVYRRKVEQPDVGSRSKATTVTDEESVPVGGGVLVAGRLNDGLRMHASGPESLIVFASGVGEDPRLALAATRRTRVETTVMLGLVAGAAGALLAAVFAGAAVPVFNPEPALPTTTYAVSYPTTYSFVDVCSMPAHGVALANTDDGSAPMFAVEVPFRVRLFGEPFSPPFTVSTNGWLSLLQTSSNSISGSLPRHAEPNATIAPYWTDVNTRADGVCYAVVGAAPNRALVVEWRNAYECCSNDEAHTLSFEAVIHEAPPHEGNVIDFVYADLHGARYRVPAVGLEDSAGANAVRIAQPRVAPSVVRFVPAR